LVETDPGMQGKDMPGVNVPGPMWSQLLNMEPPDSPLNNADEELLRGFRDGAMESLDYEVVESVAYREDQVKMIDMLVCLTFSGSAVLLNTALPNFVWVYATKIGGCIEVEV
jgi:hypothetical protein